MSELPQNYNWLSDDRFAHLKFTTRVHFTHILSGLRKMYGQAHEVDGAVEALLHVTEITWQVVRGKDKPIKSPAFFNRYDDRLYSPDE